MGSNKPGRTAGGDFGPGSRAILHNQHIGTNPMYTGMRLARATWDRAPGFPAPMDVFSACSLLNRAVHILVHDDIGPQGGREGRGFGRGLNDSDQVLQGDFYSDPWRAPLDLSMAIEEQRPPCSPGIRGLCPGCLSS